MLHRPRHTPKIVAGFIVIVAVAAPAAVANAVSASADVPMVAVAMSAPHIPFDSHYIGAMDPSTPLHVSLALEPSDPSGLAAFATAVSTPGSPDYHRFLTPSQVQARFGPGSVPVQAARAWLQSQGLSAGATSGDGLDIPASGTAAAVEAAFRTKIARFSLDDGRQVFANRTAPEVPSGLRSTVAAVLGLDDIGQARDRMAAATPLPPGDTFAVAPASHGQPVPGAASPCADAQAAATKQGSLTADQMADYYGFNSLYARRHLGQGITVGLVEFSNYQQSDVTTFEKCYGIPAPVNNVYVEGGQSSLSGRGEVVLDIETVASLAPDANIVVYIGPNGDGFRPFYDEYATIAQADQAQVVSTSWGFDNCEADMLNGSVSLSLVQEPVFQEMAAQGQTLSTAAGDQGAQGCASDIGEGGVNNGQSPNPYAPSVEDPGNEPFILAVGGTEIPTPSPTAVQQAWNKTGPKGDGSGFRAPFDGQNGRLNGYPSGDNGNLSGSGGISTFFQMPPWQVGFDKSGNASGTPCGVPPNTNGSVACRELPDVSALAVDYLIYMGTTGGWQWSGGTSAASPLWASFIALTDQAIPQHRLGLIAPALYHIARSDPSAFTPITQGNNDYLAQSGTPNDYTCTGNNDATNQPCYSATSWNESSGAPGTPLYNMVGGLGTPNAGILAEDLASYQVAISTTSLPDGAVGTRYSFTLGGEGGLPPYTWALTSGSLPAGLTLDPAAGTIRGTPTETGTFAFGIQLTGSGHPVDTGGNGLEPAPSASAILSITVGMDRGYWITTSTGQVSALGSAAKLGSAPGNLTAPVVAIASTPDGAGYWLAASDGGVFTFGDAGFFGSATGMANRTPVVAIASTPDGAGYWLAASDGGVFTFGDAGFFGSAATMRLSHPIVGMAVLATGNGYWLVGSSGQVLGFGKAATLGSPALAPGSTVGMGASTHGGGYLVLGAGGTVSAFGDAVTYARPPSPPPGANDVAIAVAR